ncbi:hypothetical protein PJ267_04495 [Arthrobacter sp. OVS8]|nr:hypothetical protein PJ267_04495 [Arthrobacter sp. OVS8]
MTIMAVLNVSARAASRANQRNVHVVGSAAASSGPDITARRAIQPAILASIDGSSGVHSTRSGECEVRPPQEYASRCRPRASAVR